MSLAQGGKGVSCYPLSVFSSPLLCHLPAPNGVVGGCGRVYAWDWVVIGDGLVAFNIGTDVLYDFGVSFLYLCVSSIYVRYIACPIHMGLYY